MRTMYLTPFLRLLRDGRLKALLGVSAEFESFYKLTYLSAAGEAGLLNRLANGPATLESLSGFSGALGQGTEAFKAWLQMGVRLRLLRLGKDGYALRGLAKLSPGPRMILY